MGGTNAVLGGNSAADQATLTRSDPNGLRYAQQVKQMTDEIYAILPGAFVDSYAYRRQIKEEFRDLGYGKGAVCIVHVSKSFLTIFTAYRLYLRPYANLDIIR